MKKIISLFVALILLQTTVFAAAADGLADVLSANRKITSAQVNAVSSLKLNKPLEIFECMPESYMSDEVDIDFKMLAESIAESETTVSVSYNSSEDFKKADFAIWAESDTPIKFNDSFELSAWAKVGMWMKYDFTDAENPVYEMILDIPFMKKYQVMDLSEYMKENPSYISLFNAEYLQEINQLATESLIKNAKITASGNTYTVKLDDAGMKAYISEVFDISKKFMDEENAEDIFEEIGTVFENISVLGDDGITMKISCDSRKNITVQDMSIHISFNVYDLLTAISKDTTGLEREKAFIDFTAVSDSKISGIGKTKVEFPDINDENSNIINVDSYGYTGGYSTRIDEEPLFEDGKVYFPIEAIIKNCKVEMTNEDGKITLYDPSSKQTAVTEINGKTVTTHGETYDIEKPVVIERDGCIYAPSDFLYAVNIYTHSANYDLDKNRFYFWFSYHETAEETEEGESSVEYEYIPPTLDYRFSLDRAAYIKNNIAYMPIYEFVQTICGYEGEFSFPDGQIIYNSTGENIFKITEFAAQTGASYVSVNGEQKPLIAPIELYEGIMYMPIDFSKSLGLDGELNIWYSNGIIMSNYSFHMPNPEYKEDSYYGTSKYYSDLYYYVNSDRVPYINEDIIYMPAYDFFGELFKGEYTFADNGFEYTASGENPHDIVKVSVYAGDDFVTVNDEQIKLDKEAVDIDGVIRIPVSFAKALGIEATDISVNYGTTYSFTMPNPDYEGELLYGNNWLYNIFR